MSESDIHKIIQQLEAALKVNETQLNTKKREEEKFNLISRTLNKELDSLEAKVEELKRRIADNENHLNAAKNEILRYQEEVVEAKKLIQKNQALSKK